MTHTGRSVTLGILLAALSQVLIAQGGWQANSEVVGRTAQQQPKFNYEEARVGSYTLPDPLATRAGTVKTIAEWGPRRTEILNLFRDNVYGRLPGQPERLRFDVIEENPRALGGAATLRRIAVISGQNDREHRFDLTVFLPNAVSGRSAVFLLLN
jgi:hypothetical protein